MKPLSLGGNSIPAIKALSILSTSKQNFTPLNSKLSSFQQLNQDLLNVPSRYFASSSFPKTSSWSVPNLISAQPLSFGQFESIRPLSTNNVLYSSSPTFSGIPIPSFSLTQSSPLFPNTTRRSFSSCPRFHSPTVNLPPLNETQTKTLPSDDDSHNPDSSHISTSSSSLIPSRTNQSTNSTINSCEHQNRTSHRNVLHIDPNIRILFQFLLSSPVLCDKHKQLSTPPPELLRDSPQYKRSQPIESSPSIIRPEVSYPSYDPKSQFVSDPKSENSSTTPAIEEKTTTIDGTFEGSNEVTSSYPSIGLLDDDFPYTCPASASVRVYHPQKKPWWKVLLA